MAAHSLFYKQVFWLLASAHLPFLADLTSEFQVEDPHFDNARKSSLRCRWYLYNRTDTGHSNTRKRYATGYKVTSSKGVMANRCS